MAAKRSTDKMEIRRAELARRQGRLEDRRPQLDRLKARNVLIGSGRIRHPVTGDIVCAKEYDNYLREQLEIAAQHFYDDVFGGVQ